MKFHELILKHKNQNLICLGIVFMLFAIDRISKNKIINSTIEINKIFINDFVNFDLVWNTGIGFGLFSSNSTLIYNFITGIIGIVILIITYLLIKSSVTEKFFFSIILGGAIGNFYDRMIFLAVPDFIDVHFNNFHWFTFNMADIFITIGVLMLISKEIFFKNEK